MRISDWSSDVCSSDLRNVRRTGQGGNHFRDQDWSSHKARSGGTASRSHIMMSGGEMTNMAVRSRWPLYEDDEISAVRSEEHTSELQSLMRISYAVFYLKKKKRLTRATTRPPAAPALRNTTHKRHQHSSYIHKRP